ncbi:MAG TPA: peptidase, partial [Geobacterales bacterium]|nr:peptidase [Geobacterales bacterium]
SMRVDWQALAERTRRVAEVVNGGVAVEISSTNGSRLTLRTDGRIAKGDDGILTTAGSFGNLPAGEVYLAPLEGTAEGRLVLEWGPTRKFSSPIELEVRQGNVVSLRGDDPYCRQLEEKFAESAKNRNIAELGIGTNDRATRPDNVLEAEKILGTIHIALGDNAGFGGTVQTPFHEDFVFYQPTVEIIAASGSRTTLLNAGKLQV